MNINGLWENLTRNGERVIFTVVTYDYTDTYYFGDWSAIARKYNAHYKVYAFGGGNTERDADSRELYVIAEQFDANFMHHIILKEG